MAKRKLRLEDPPISISSCVCSEHFEPECFERDLKSEMLVTKAIRRLKAEAVPTIISFAPSKPQHTTGLKCAHTAVSSQTVILFVRS